MRKAHTNRRACPLAVDYLEPRQLLNAAPMHFHAESLRHQGAAFVENARHAHHASAKISADPTPLSGVKGLKIVSSPQIDGQLLATSAISANDIWAVGLVFTSLGGQATLTEHWDGTSWRIINSPNPGNFQNGLSGSTALSDGTVAAVGFQRDQGFDATPLILQS